ncbi:MAG: DUF3168 domain-containing protein [Sphingomonadales bacterium]
MTDARLALQTSIFSTLNGDASLAANVTGIFDGASQGQAYPYIELVEVDSDDWSTKTFDGEKHRFVINVWANGPGKKETYEIVELIDGLLNKAALSLTGHQLVEIRRQSRSVTNDVQENIVQGRMVFLATTIEN